MPVKRLRNSLVAGAVALAAVALSAKLTREPGASSAQAAGYEWSGIPTIAMRGNLKIFWNVYDWTVENTRQAYAHGFMPISLVDPYANRSGGGKESLYPVVNKDNHNPFVKPRFFESVIKGDIKPVPDHGTFVHDIEFEFSHDTRKAWADPVVRGLSGVDTFADFEDAYYHEWASWYTLPLKWTKELHPNTHLGLYGRQPFERDYWGIANQTTAAIEAKHQLDWRLWKSIDPYVDVYIVDIYTFYARPDSVYYMASNVEHNFQRTRRLGHKPVYVYEWMRYHDSSLLEGNRELDPFLVEAMAIVPYFSGATGIVLWGHEPKLNPGDGQPYENMPLYMKTLERVAALSDKIGRGKIVIDEPAHVLWKERRPLLRRIDIGASECVALAINPWQGDDAVSSADVTCGDKTFPLEMQGKHATLAHIADGAVNHY
jgi:hypothetical protein